MPNTTWADGAGGGTPLSAARLNNLELGAAPTYEDYTPAWTTGGTQPVLGNGTLVGRYMQRGKFVTGYLILTAGSTTTFGTTAWIFSLPVASRAGFLHNYLVWLDDATAGPFMGMARQVSSTTIVCFHATGATVMASVTGTAPFAWTTSDRLVIHFTYEAA